MRSLTKNILRISNLYPPRSSVQVGRCHYHSGLNKVPIVKTIDDEILVKVNLGISRQIELRVRQPPRPESNSPVIIFLKRGIPTPTQNESCIKDLAIGANALAIEINYGLSAQYTYPAPIHAVLAGYDWVRKNLARGSIAHTDQRITTKPSKIGVCGELIGGSLATMLALTECVNTSAELQPQGISALAVGNPILDWTVLTRSDATPIAPQEEISRRAVNSLTGADNETLSANRLCDIRQACFPKAETYFDPFASPLLFFCTPTSEIPNEVVAPVKGFLLDGGPEAEDPTLPLVKKRRSARKYPPMGSNLLFPWTKVEVGKDWLLKDQGVDLVEMMRKSFKRSEAERAADMGKAFERDFDIVDREGVGLWDEKHMFEIGLWFGEILRKP